jgi:hypothetical protein
MSRKPTQSKVISSNKIKTETDYGQRIVISFGKKVERAAMVAYCKKYLFGMNETINVKTVNEKLALHNIRVHFLDSGYFLLTHDDLLVIDPKRSLKYNAVEDKYINPKLNVYYKLIKILNNLPLDLDFEDENPINLEKVRKYKRILQEGPSEQRSNDMNIFPEQLYCITTHKIQGTDD